MTVKRDDAVHPVEQPGRDGEQAPEVLAQRAQRRGQDQRDEQQEADARRPWKRQEAVLEEAPDSAPGFGSTSQIVFIESCNWPKTPVAANSRVTRPMMPASCPRAGFWALAMHLLDGLGPLLADELPDLRVELPRAACSPKTRPATAMAMTSSGASESTL